MFTAEQKKLFRKNYKVFCKVFPAMQPILDGEIPENIKIINDEGVDIDINGGRFYGVPADVYVGKQLDFFLRNPNILEVNPNSPDGSRTPFHVKSLVLFNKMFQRRIGSATMERLRFDAATTFIFGLGLGLHVYPLVADTRCREIVIVEPEPLFLVLSLYFSDWSKIFRTLNNRVSFIFDKEPEASFAAMRGHIHLRNPGVQQTIFYFQHYHSEYLDGIYKGFQKNSYLFFDGLGFYDDEKVMTRNFINNMYMDDWIVCSAPMRPAHGTAVIVGAGPSLDDDIPWLRENQENLIIFSGSSALQPLLKAGIVPDFHAEIENVAMNYDLLKPHVDSGKLNKTYLVCSSTMDARSARLFPRRAWFMREGVMCSSLFPQSPSPISWQNPTAVNTALSAALHLGFREIVFVGADFGTLDPERHHASGSAYETFEELKTASFKFPEKVAGNFGNVAYTNTHYMSGISCIKFLSRLFRGAKLRNASNGVKIDTVAPIRTHRVKIQPLNGPKTEYVDNIMQTVMRVNWAEVVGSDLFEDLKREFSEYISLLKDIVYNARRRNRDFILFVSAVFSEINKITSPLAKFNPMITGSIVNDTIFMVHSWRRIFDDDLKKYGSLSYDFLMKWLLLLERDFHNFVDNLRQELPLVRPELFDDKGTLIVEAKPGVQNAE